jgi:hypothetical protein
VLRSEGTIRLSALVAWEEMAAGWRGPQAAFWDAAVLHLNFARGALNAQMYRLTVGQLVLAAALGLLVGLNFAAARRAGRGGGAVGACRFGAGGGAAATLCAATAGALGCCGGSSAVGMVAMLGVSVPAAAVLGQIAGVVQAAIIVLLAANLAWFARRRSALPAGPPAARGGRAENTCSTLGCSEGGGLSLADRDARRPGNIRTFERPNALFEAGPEWTSCSVPPD